MPSPFPGMDPYLEEPRRWGGVHHLLITAIHDALNTALPEGFFAEVEQYVLIEEDDPESDDRPSPRNPDVFIPDSGSVPNTTKARGSSTLGLLDPPTSIVTLKLQPLRKSYRILVQTQDGRGIITAIELLSPSNKTPGPNREAYLAKRNEFLGAGTNLMELDLLRDGDRLPMGKPRPAIADYYFLVSEAVARPKTSVWAFSVRESIPVIPVHLTSAYDPVPLNLRQALDRVYDGGRYSQKLDYSKPCTPPLNGPDRDWANSFLKKPTRKKK